MYAPQRAHEAAREKVEHRNSRAIEMSAAMTSDGRSSKSTPLSSSPTLTKVKEVWERLADGKGMGRRRWALGGRGEVGFVESEEVLSGGLREERADEWPRTGVET